jgi:two-component system, NarL family, sensor kinase
LYYANVIIPAALILLFYIIHKIFLRKENKVQHKQNDACVDDNNSRHLIQSEVDLQEQTHRKISTEIHDNICLTLSLSKLYLTDLNYNDPSDTHDKVSTSISLLKKAMADLNDMSKWMNPDVIEKFGLIKAIEELVNDLQRTEHYDADMLITGNIRRIAPEKELMIFRVIQEAVNNILKQANAKSIRISVVFRDAFIEAEISDNGKGFEANPFAGMGITNMRQRTKLLAGKLSIQENNGGGITVTLTVPEKTNQLNTCKQIPLLSE